MLHAYVGDEVFAVDVERSEAGIDGLVDELIDRYRNSCRYLIAHLYWRVAPDRIVNRGEFAETSPAAASRALAELHRLMEDSPADVEVSSLVDVDTGRLLARSRRWNSVELGSVGRDTASHCDLQGFAIKRRPDEGSPQTCFSSVHFLQLPLPDTAATGAYGLVKIHDEQQIEQLREFARSRTGPFASVHPDQHPDEVTVRQETPRQGGGTNVGLRYGLPAIATPCVLRFPGGQSGDAVPEHIRGESAVIPFEALYGDNIEVLGKVLATAVRTGRPVRWTSEYSERGSN